MFGTERFLSLLSHDVNGHRKAHNMELDFFRCVSNVMSHFDCESFCYESFWKFIFQKVHTKPTCYICSQRFIDTLPFPLTQLPFLHKL